MTYTYVCSSAECAKESGTFTTTIAPGTFPSCTWCGRLLKLVQEADITAHKKAIVARLSE